MSYQRLDNGTTNKYTICHFCRKEYPNCKQKPTSLRCIGYSPIKDDIVYNFCKVCKPTHKGCLGCWIGRLDKMKKKGYTNIIPVNCTDEVGMTLQFVDLVYCLNSCKNKCNEIDRLIKTINGED